MDYETFEKFFDRMAKEKSIEIGEYSVEYGRGETYAFSFMGDDIEVIYYHREGYVIGADSMYEYYKPGEIMPEVKTSFDKGIKNFNSLIEYLDYLYNSNIDRLKEEERQREQERINHLKKEEHKERKLDYFLNSN